MRQFPRPTYANVAATLALCVALTGTASAAGVINITGAQVENGSLTGADLANHSVGLKKLKSKAVEALRGARGPAGPAGHAGPAGPAGRQGAPGPAGKDGATGKDGASGQAGAIGPAGPSGPAGTKIQLAGYATTNDQVLPDDSDPHTIWSMSFDVTAGEAFIATGSLGGAYTSGCPDGDNALVEDITLDGQPFNFNGALLTFSPGHHTLAYSIHGTCTTTGHAVHVPAQQVILIPFKLP
ncbi:MAG TPA: hypothetical protein VLJ44_13750 [Gaiellaceae bacterium]|nr:hypothetical protein [Gaiellaceae bacterium]